jgi:hypothetical protein
MKDEYLEAYVRSLMKSAESINKNINYVELRALIRRFLQLNPHSDPRVIDWVGVWDDKLTYEEQVENFHLHYPMYKWLDTTEVATEEAFESAKKRRLYHIIKDLDEESLRELAQLISQELGGFPQAAQTEKKKEPAIQTPTITSTHTVPSAQQPAEPKEPKITLRVLAGVPVLLEARAFASAFDTAELLQDQKLIEKTKKRVEIAIRGFPWPFGDPLEDLLTFGLGMMFVSQIRDRRVWERWAEAEAKRIEAFLNLSDNGILETVWKDLIIRAERCGPEEERRTGLPYRIHVADYFRLVKGIEGVEWRQKRTVSRGWVYVHRAELIRLLAEEAKLKILKKLETVPRIQAKQIQKIVDDIKQTLTLT